MIEVIRRPGGYDPAMMWVHEIRETSGGWIGAGWTMDPAHHLYLCHAKLTKNNQFGWIESRATREGVIRDWPDLSDDVKFNFAALTISASPNVAPKLSLGDIIAFEKMWPAFLRLMADKDPPDYLEREVVL